MNSGLLGCEPMLLGHRLSKCWWTIVPLSSGSPWTAWHWIWKHSISSKTGNYSSKHSNTFQKASTLNIRWHEVPHWFLKDMLQTVTVILVPDSDVSGMPLPQGYVANCNSYCSTWLGCV